MDAFDEYINLVNSNYENENKQMNFEYNSILNENSKYMLCTN